MMFRKLYWVAEHLDSKGHSSVIGVYTSIPDLVRHGIRWAPGHGPEQLRLTLTKLDSDMPPLGVWRSPHFESIDHDLEPYVRTEEFSAEHCSLLAESLRPFMPALAA